MSAGFVALVLGAAIGGVLGGLPGSILGGLLGLTFNGIARYLMRKRLTAPVRSAFPSKPAPSFRPSSQPKSPPMPVGHPASTRRVKAPPAVKAPAAPARTPTPEDAPAFPLSKDQRAALEYLVSPQWEHMAVFVTGPAGTGKSTLLRELQRQTAGRSAVVAPTGIAAVNVRGQTIHSFFRFRPRLLRFRDPEDIRVPRTGSPYRRMLEKLELLIIDEVSMVRADLLDAIDWKLRLARNSDRPFGGVRVAMFGDPMQLEPVVQDDEAPYIIQTWGSPFFFDAHVWSEGSFICFILDQIHRQSSDPIYARTVCDLRRGHQDAVRRLSELARLADTPDQDAVILTPRREAADALNRRRLHQLPGKMHTYEGQIRGTFNEKNVPAEKVLQLKVGAQVMTLRNMDRCVNGDIGTVVALHDDAVTVRLRRGAEVALEPAVWENVTYKYDAETRTIEPVVVGSFRQIPLRLAWALTIHKAQGLTLDKVHVEFERGMFAHGQTYVAVTRCRTSNGLSLSRPLSEGDILWANNVQRFLEYVENHRTWCKGAV